MDMSVAFRFPSAPFLTVFSEQMPMAILYYRRQHVGKIELQGRDSHLEIVGKKSCTADVLGRV
jgi:hypothetical protein